MISTLILGGARSGKSAYAESLAAASGKEVVYLATAQARDNEMASRIALHRQQRPAHWRTLEEPYALGEMLEQWSRPERVVLIDCLSLWLSNLLGDFTQPYPEVGPIMPPPTYQQLRQHFLQALQSARGEVLLVTNEIGMSVVPLGALTRWYVDEAGRLNQDVAACCQRVVLVVAGLPLQLKA